MHNIKVQEGSNLPEQVPVIANNDFGQLILSLNKPIDKTVLDLSQLQFRYRFIAYQDISITVDEQQDLIYHYDEMKKSYQDWSPLQVNYGTENYTATISVKIQDLQKDSVYGIEVQIKDDRSDYTAYSEPSLPSHFVIINAGEPSIQIKSCGWVNSKVRIEFNFLSFGLGNPVSFNDTLTAEEAAIYRDTVAGFVMDPYFYTFFIKATPPGGSTISSSFPITVNPAASDQSYVIEEENKLEDTQLYDIKLEVMDAYTSVVYNLGTLPLPVAPFAIRKDFCAVNYAKTDNNRQSAFKVKNLSQAGNLQDNLELSANEGQLITMKMGENIEGKQALIFEYDNAAGTFKLRFRL